MTKPSIRPKILAISFSPPRLVRYEEPCFWPNSRLTHIISSSLALDRSSSRNANYGIAMFPLSQHSFDQRLACLMQAVRRELHGLDALSYEDSGVIEAALAEVRRANMDTMKALFPLIAHINYIDNCLIHRQEMWDTTKAIKLWFGRIKSLGRLVLGKRDGFYGALERTTASFESALETTELAFRCGEKMAVVTSRVCNKNVLQLQGEISNVDRELQTVATVCAEEEENVKMKSKYLEDSLQAELRGREDLEDEILEEPVQRGRVLKETKFEADSTKASVDTARAVMFVVGLAFTFTIPGVVSVGFFASVGAVAFLASWTKIFDREKDTKSIQNEIVYSEQKAQELEGQLKAIKEKTSRLQKAAEAYKEAQHLFSLLSPRARSMQLMTSQFETLLRKRKTVAETRLAKIRNIRPPNSPSWYRPSRADVIDLLDEILKQFKQDYEEDAFTSEEEAIITKLEKELSHLRSRTKPLQQIHSCIKSESDGIEDSNEMQMGSQEHLRLSAIMFATIAMTLIYAWSNRQCFLQGAKFITRQAGKSILWTLKGMIIKLWQTLVNMFFGLRTPFRLLCALAPNVTYFILGALSYLARLVLGYALMLPAKMLLVVGLLLLRVFTARLVVLGVMGWVLVYHGPAWDEIWDIVHDWAVWGILAGWRWLWEFSGVERASQALVIAS
ncbi:hypothetical protein L873DRAFT_1795023 [Choiromyces venosus 120613-1]|uniref:Uncharacterized protein n=1 Tax=Choiromyces venosus 120613-1 TaxID=1336337 RepID=A0A3N4IZ52_9PEZI|nr:hypothetical protein L873DRAFT_1795023 [Choiromyces venosus 120613-1]